MWKLFGAFPWGIVGCGCIFAKDLLPWWSNYKIASPTGIFFTELRRFFIILAFVQLVGLLGLKAQQLLHLPTTVDARIALKGAEIQGSYVVISYKIPYSGMVEIRLFDTNGQKIWQNQYADTFGENRIVLKASKFNPGQTYAYQLNYKRDQVTQNFVVPPSGYN